MARTAPASFQEYALEVCGFCGGRGHSGLDTNQSCLVCKNTGKTLVRQPPVRCPCCDGGGKAKSRLDSHLYPRCALCRGAGWVLALTG